jgi:hypothetical protein
MKRLEGKVTLTPGGNSGIGILNTSVASSDRHAYRERVFREQGCGPFVCANRGDAAFG